MAKTSTQHSKTFLSAMRELLKEHQEKLERELGAFADKNAAPGLDYDARFPEYGTEEDENAREIADYTANKPLELALEKELRDIHKSLKRIDEGTYGICKYCGELIPEKRLEARPTSSSCVSCKKTLTQEA